MDVAAAVVMIDFEAFAVVVVDLVAPSRHDVVRQRLPPIAGPVNPATRITRPPGIARA